MRLIIASRNDLEEAGRLVSWLNRPVVDHVVVTIPRLDIDERQRMAKALESHFNDCGCTWGMLALVPALVWCLAARPWGAASLWAAAGYTVAASVAAAVAGKMVGLTWSYWRLRVLFRRMAH